MQIGPEDKIAGCVRRFDGRGEGPLRRHRCGRCNCCPSRPRPESGAAMLDSVNNKSTMRTANRAFAHGNSDLGCIQTSLSGSNTASKKSPARIVARLCHMIHLSPEYFSSHRVIRHFLSDVAFFRSEILFPPQPQSRRKGSPPLILRPHHPPSQRQTLTGHTVPIRIQPVHISPRLFPSSSRNTPAPTPASRSRCSCTNPHSTHTALAALTRQ